MTVTYYIFVIIGVCGYWSCSVGTSNQNDNALAFKTPNGNIVTIVFNSNNNDAQTTVSVVVKYQFNVPGKGWAISLVVNSGKTSFSKESTNNLQVKQWT